MCESYELSDSSELPDGSGVCVFSRGWGRYPSFPARPSPLAVAISGRGGQIGRAHV